MSEIVYPRFGDEPPQRKQKLETPSCSASAPSAESIPLVEDDPLSEEDELDSEEEMEYQRQVRESDGFDVDYFPHPCGGIFPDTLRDNYTPFSLRLYSRLGLHCYNLQKGTNLKLIGIHKYNTEMGVPFGYYITLEAADTCNNTPCTFQTCLTEHRTPKWGYCMVQTELSRLKVPPGPRATPVGPERRWRDKAIADFYKGVCCYTRRYLPE